MSFHLKMVWNWLPVNLNEPWLIVTNVAWLCTRSLTGPVGVWTWIFSSSESPGNKKQLPFTYTVNKMRGKKQKTVWEQTRGTKRWVTHTCSLPVCPLGTNTHGKWDMWAGERQPVSWWLCSKDNGGRQRLACIRCWWVAAEQTSSQGTKPAPVAW